MNKVNKKNNKFTWGDAVLIKQEAPTCYHPGEFASICGIDTIITQEEANKLFCQKGDWIYIVEFDDGSSIEVPECYLEKYIE